MRGAPRRTGSGGPIPPKGAARVAAISLQEAPVQRLSDHQENKMRKISPLALAALLALAGPAWAQSVKAIVTKVDQVAGKVTLDHERIPKLDMDAMTMAYKVKDPAMLKDLKSGDKVDFEVDEADGQYTVTKIRKAK
ncbi:hypothetical protein MetexDRAFT_2401 [Methylorubrum extorquens DSM 13060]|nr:hypothetical protein MetexDRAFT_2401 [Methylorubrum extorquens DSM 13060]